MAYQILSRTFSDVVTLEEAATHLRIYDVYDESYVQTLIEASTEVAEKYMNRLIPSSSVIIQRESLLDLLPLGRASSVSSVTYLDGTSEERLTLDPSLYSFNVITNRIEMKSVDFKALDYSGAFSYQITFTTGWIKDEVPASVKHGILMLVGTLYEFREDAISDQGVSGKTVPVTHQYLFNKHKQYAL